MFCVNGVGGPITNHWGGPRPKPYLGCTRCTQDVHATYSVNIPCSVGYDTLLVPGPLTASDSERRDRKSCSRADQQDRPERYRMHHGHPASQQEYQTNCDEGRA
jgi:hypothetical protein